MTTKRQRRLNDKKRAARLSAARQLGTHTKAEWLALIDEVGCRCVRCGATETWLLKDHILPIYQGGSDAISNLQPMCWTCNSSKGSDSTNFLAQWRDKNAPTR